MNDYPEPLQWNAAPGERSSDPEWEPRQRLVECGPDIQCVNCVASSSEDFHWTPDGVLCDSCWHIRNRIMGNGE